MRFSRFGGRVVVAVCLLVTVSACSKLKGYFPDKERDYQLMTEIPPLVVPEDLGRPSIDQAPILTPKAVPAAAVVAEAQTVHVERVVYDGGATRLRIDQPFSKSWRLVGKALSRQSVEITGRDKPAGLYIVMYDPNEQKVRDDSLWDEVLFVFGQLGGNEQEYRIKLLESQGQTEVIVMDENDKPLSKGPGLSLLELLHKSIEENLADKGQASADEQ